MSQAVENLSAMQKTWVESLVQEDSLEKGMASLSSILGWRIPWIEETGELQSMGLQSGFSFFFFFFSLEEPEEQCLAFIFSR